MTGEPGARDPRDPRDLGPRHFAGPVLLPYQAAWNQETAKLAVAEKGRRIGLSWGEAAEDALLASLAPADGGMNVWYISYNKEMTEQFVKDVAFWARVYQLAADDVEEGVEVFQDGDEQKSVTVYRVRFASGHTVTGLPSHPRVLRSKQGKVVIDEAAFVDNLDEVLKAALALVIWGAVVRVISTHDGEDNPFNQLVQDIRAGRRPGAIHRYPFSLAVEQGLFSKICLKLGREWSPEAEAEFVAETRAIYKDNSDEELECIPSRGGGAYLVRTVIEACMSPAIPVLRWAPPARDFVDWPEDSRWREMQAFCEGRLAPILAGLDRQRRHFLGQDFGRLVDLSVVWPLQEMADLVLATPFVLELRDCPFSQQEQVLFFIVDRLPRFSGGALDAGGNGAFLAERARQRYGADRIAEVKFHEAWNLAHWPPLKAALEDRMRLLPRDADILEDLRAVRTVRGVPRIPDKRSADATGKRHGDAAVALVLADFAARAMNAAGPIEVVTAGPRMSASMFRGY